MRGRAGRHQAVLSLLAGDDDMAQLVAAWMAKGRHDQLLELWAHGHAIDWQALYGGQAPRRISLPTYPFARQRCWMDAPRQESLAVEGAAAMAAAAGRVDADADARPSPPMAPPAGTAPATDLPGRTALARLAGAAAAEEITRGLARLVDEVLGTTVSRDFSAGDLAGLPVAMLGMDSLSGMALRKRVRAWLDVDLPPDIVVDAPTFQALAERIHERLLLDRLTLAAPAADDAAPPCTDEVFVV